MSDQEFAKTLKEWRERHGLSRREAAKVLRANARTLEGWEYGKGLSEVAKLGLHVLMKKHDEKSK